MVEIKKKEKQVRMERRQRQCIKRRGMGKRRK